MRSEDQAVNTGRFVDGDYAYEKGSLRLTAMIGRTSFPTLQYPTLKKAACCSTCTLKLILTTSHSHHPVFCRRSLYFCVASVVL